MSAEKEAKLNFPDRQTREKCWSSRDDYWKCLDDNKDDESKCSQLKKLHESVCPQLWVTHYIRKRKYDKFKEKMAKEDFDPIDYYAQQQKEQEQHKNKSKK